MNEVRANGREGTPVDDVRRVRDRLAREAHGDVRELAERSKRAYDELRQRLGLRSPEAGGPTA
ncbi:MAG TPA: hypothetical protein VHQ47_20800 [Phycisphaerae bacterium]|nr:hypothetical protein [Phycisphaerae bacterium]